MKGIVSTVDAGRVADKVGAGDCYRMMMHKVPGRGMPSRGEVGTGRERERTRCGLDVI
jgi:hypothetical protein